MVRDYYGLRIGLLRFAGDVDEEEPVDKAEYVTEVPEKENELSSDQEDFEAGMVEFLGCIMVSDECFSGLQ
jgi:hypothetical protein